jgi:hypothetical protein
MHPSRILKKGASRRRRIDSPSSGEDKSLLDVFHDALHPREQDLHDKYE